MLSHAFRSWDHICTVPLLLCSELGDVLYKVVDLHGCTTVCVSDVTVGISGHGFLIASDNLTRHPSGPGIQPGETISTFDWNRGRGVFKKYHSIPQCPFRHRPSPPSRFA